MGVTSLSVFGGNFVLAKVHWGLISVRKINRGQVSRPLYRGCPLFGGSVIRGFTVVATTTRGGVLLRASNCAATI